MKYALLIFSFFFAGLLSAQKVPFPKLQKMAESGNVEQCLTTCKEKIAKAKGPDKQWLYGMMSYCELQIFNKKGGEKDDLLKKSMSYAANMKKAVATSGEIDFTNDPFFSSHLRLLNQTLLQRITHFNTEDFGKIIQQSETVFGQQSTLILRITYSEFQGNSYAVKQQLKYLVNLNYTERKNGDTTGCLPLYQKLWKGYAEEGEPASGNEVIQKAAEVYPNAAGVYKQGFEDYFFILQSSGIQNIEQYQNWQKADSFFSLKLPEKKQALLSAATDNYLNHQLENLSDYSTYLNFVKYLNGAYPTQYPPVYFEKKLLNKGSERFALKDSWMLSALMDIQNFKNPQQKLIYCNGWVKQLLDSGYILYASQTYLFLKQNFKGQTTELQKIKTLIDKSSLKGLDADLFKGDFRVALQYLHDHPTDKQTYKKVLDFTTGKLSTLMLKNDFSQCMRITKTMNEVFARETTFQGAVLQWKKADYYYNYESLKSGFSFSGKGTDEKLCKPGVVEEADNARFLRVLNYCRRTAGLFDSCVLNSQYNQLAQAAALIMSANYHLTHAPGKDEKCYTEAGYKGASRSNLSLGADGINGMLIQLDDSGPSNSSVGHRCWILYPANTVFGLGSAKGAMALYVLGSEKINNYEKRNPFNETMEFVSWPASGYFPYELLIDRWSFSMSGAGFEKATVTLSQNGVVKQGVIENRNGSYGLSTLVWNAGDMKFVKSVPVTVKINNVQKYDANSGTNKNLSFEYQVIMF